MTEVRSIPGSGGSGLFATKDYNVGDVILEEDAPLVQLAPQSLAHQEERILADCCIQKQASADSEDAQSKDDTPSLWRSLVPPSTVDEKNHGKFKGMVQAALCYADSEVSSETRESLLQLYHPSISESDTVSPAEQEIVNVSELAMAYLQELVDSKSKLYTKLADKETLQKVMLVWSCNSFDGGRVYDTISRINHSCDPNAVVITDDTMESKQTIKAATAITAGDEISISYLGLLLYADRSIRCESLLQTKHFQCQCSRCASATDFAAAFPCPLCHARKHQLPEDVQYDDDDETVVHYVTPTAAAATTSKDNGSSCFACDNTSLSHAALNACTPLKTSLVINRAVSDKVAVFLQDHEAIQKLKGNNKDEDEEQKAVQGELLEQTLGMASSVVGSKHWSTNLVMLLQLERTLESFHEGMLKEEPEPDMGALAEAIDMLEGLCRYVDGLNLKLHNGHLLSSMVIGVARALVSLGDVKSQKYASEWLKRLAGFVEHFESAGIQKVVSSLQLAWTRQGTSSSVEVEMDADVSNKRAKKS